MKEGVRTLTYFKEFVNFTSNHMTHNNSNVRTIIRDSELGVGIAKRTIEGPENTFHADVRPVATYSICE